MKIRNMFLSAALAATAATASAQQSVNNNATQAYDKTNVQAQLRLNIEKDTDTVHFIRDNADPYVITKTYVLKNADVYELRPYLRSVITAKKITQDNTFVECIKYNDGTGILIVSAEEDRFGKQANGMGIDEIVAAIDQPKITSSSGMERFLYFPMYRNANDLATMVTNVGTTHVDDSYELQQGTDKVYTDGGLNAVFFYVPKFSKKNIESMLSYYDVPMNQATVRYTVYEIYAENDGKIGADFQSWKNNDGADLLSVGGRYRSNWSATWNGGIDPINGSNKTEYFNANPKWNSKYLDFLVSKSKAKIMTTGSVAIRNNQPAVITKVNNLFYDKNTPMADKAFDQTTSVANKKISSTKPTTFSNVIIGKDSGYDYYFDAKDDNNNAFTVSYNGTAISGSNGCLGAVKIQPGSNGTATYNLSVTGFTLVHCGNNEGRQVECTTFKLYKRSWASDAEATSTSVPNNYSYEVWTEVPLTTDVSIAKGNRIDTIAGSGYGFTMTVTPQINRDASSLSIKMTNTSLIGWKSTGEPRVAPGNEIVTDIMIKNGNSSFLIGGLEKQTVVRSVGGVPFLRELPGLGWVFSTETESTKKSQLVVFAECALDDVKAPVSDAVTSTMKAIDSKTRNAGKSNTWGFDQYLIDKDKK